MRGEFIAVWSATWGEIWEALEARKSAPLDLFCELYRELAEALKDKPSHEVLADILDDPSQARETFQTTTPLALRGERAVAEFLERAHDVLVDLGGDALSNDYFLLVSAFLEKYSLRYELRRPFALTPTLPGVFAKLIRELKEVTRGDAHLDSLMKEFEESVRDIRAGALDGRIKTCIQKQVNLLEAMGRMCPGITQNTLGAICDQVRTWPHAKVKDAMKNLYGFASDYPGIRHGGTPTNAVRAIEMRDMIAISILLAGFTPYLTHQLNADDIFGGSQVWQATVADITSKANRVSGRTTIPARLGAVFDWLSSLWKWHRN